MIIRLVKLGLTLQLVLEVKEVLQPEPEAISLSSSAQLI